jgi:hypothetical protein
MWMEAAGTASDRYEGKSSTVANEGTVLELWLKCATVAQPPRSCGQDLHASYDVLARDNLMSQKGHWAKCLASPAQPVIDGTATENRKGLHHDLEIAIPLSPSHSPPDCAI